MLKFSHVCLTMNFTSSSLRRTGFCLFLAAASIMAAAQAGKLDPTFANKGLLFDNFNGATGSASAVAVQSDGKIVVGGQLGASNSANRGVVLRLNRKGSFDNSFGTNGVVTIKFGAIDNRLAAMALQSDGKSAAFF